MGDWQRASMVPELSLSIIKAGQLAVALKGSGGGYGSLPPEPTLRDLAALGSLQEKVSLLDNTVSHLQESLRLKEEELLSVHQELDDKTKYAQELSVKLGGLEERFTAVNQLREGLDKAVEAEHGVENTVEKQSKLIEDLTTQLRALRDEQKQVEELRSELSRVKDEQKRAQEETERKLAEARAAAEEADKKAADAAARAAEAAARPAPAPSPLGGPALGGQSLGGPSAPLGGPSLDAPLGGPAPMGLKPEPSVSEKLGLPSERPAGAPLTLDAPAPLSPLGDSKPLEPLGPGANLGLGEAKPLQPLGAGASFEAYGSGAPLQPLGAGASMDPLGGAGVIPPAPVVADAAAPAEAPKKGKKPLALVAVVVLVAGGFGALKFMGAKKKAAAPDMPAAPVADRTPLPPPAPVEPPKPTPEELAEQEKQSAIALVKNWPLPNAMPADSVLEPQGPQAVGLSPWMADKGKDGLYQVNFYAPKTDKTPALAYEFTVSLADKKVSAHNKNAQALLAGQPVEAETKVAKHNTRRPKIRPKAVAKKKAAESQDSGLLSDLLSVDDQQPAKKPSAKKAAPAEEGVDTLVDGSDHQAAPQQVASRPMRKAPPKRAEKRNVDKELNDLLSGDDQKPVQKAEAPKDESLDDLLAPGQSKPGDAAPVAEPSAAGADGSAPVQKGAEATMPPADEPADAQADAAPAKHAPKPSRKKGGAADAELLDDLLK